MLFAEIILCVNIFLSINIKEVAAISVFTTSEDQIYHRQQNRSESATLGRLDFNRKAILCLYLDITKSLWFRY